MSVVDEAILLKMAEAEILGEAKKAAIRHSIAGVSGWQPCPKPNKAFLTNTLLQTMASNRILDVKTKGEKDFKPKKSERKLLQKNSKRDMKTDFIYQRPKKFKEKPIVSSKSIIYNNNTIKSGSRNLKNKNKKQIKEKFNNKKFKLKTV